MRKTIITALATGALAIGVSGFASAPAQAMPVASAAAIGGSSDLVTNVQWRGRHWAGGPRYYGPRHGYRRNNVGPAIGAGVLGLATGAIIGGALAQPRTYYEPGYSTYYEPGYTGTVAPAYGGGDVEYCMRRYRSYDPRSGTFLGYDGLRHPCP
jgi:hypothetical protein